MSKKKHCIAYEPTLYNVSETMEILKNCPPDVFFKVYHKRKKRRNTHMKKNENKLTLSQRMDRLENTVNDLATVVKEGFKQVNDRIDKIDARLDYIVKANNLKDNK